MADSASSQTALRASQAAIGALAFCYVLQVFSPLRLNTDAVTLLSIGKSAAAGHGFLQYGRATVFPPGYPALLALLLMTGLGHSWAIIALNLAMLAVAMLAAYRIFMHDLLLDPLLALNLCSLSLLSFVIIKHFTLALTDIAFMSLAMCALAVMSHAAVVTWGRRYAFAVAASWGLVVASIAVRRIGVALIPPFVLMVTSRPEMKPLLRDLSTRAKAIIAAVVAVSVLAIAWVVAGTSTLRDLPAAMSSASPLHTVVKILYFRLSELGQLTLNVPDSRLPSIFHVIVPIVGLVALLLTLGGLVSIVRKRPLRALDAFLISYVAILFVWPYADTRFWIPLIPLLAGYLTVALRRLPLPRLAIAAYLSIFAILGLAAIAYTTRITFAGSKFPDLYGDGALRPTYCEAFHSCAGAYDRGKVNPEALDLIQIYR